MTFPGGQAVGTDGEPSDCSHRVAVATNRDLAENPRDSNSRKFADRRGAAAWVSGVVTVGSMRPEIQRFPWVPVPRDASSIESRESPNLFHRDTGEMRCQHAARSYAVHASQVAGRFTTIGGRQSIGGKSCRRCWLSEPSSQAYLGRLRQPPSSKYVVPRSLARHPVWGERFASPKFRVHLDKFQPIWQPDRPLRKILLGAAWGLSKFRCPREVSPSEVLWQGVCYALNLRSWVPRVVNGLRSRINESIPSLAWTFANQSREGVWSCLSR